MNATEYCDDCMGAASTMESVQYLLLGITLIVVLLVCILMERSFLADEKSQIAVLKAMGFGNRRVMEWHMIRFGIVTLVAVLLAAICSIPATYLIGNPIFGMMKWKSGLCDPSVENLFPVSGHYFPYDASGIGNDSITDPDD